MIFKPQLYTFSKQRKNDKTNDKTCDESDCPVAIALMPQILNNDGTVNKPCPLILYENYINDFSEKCHFLWQASNDATFNKGDLF